MDRSDTRCNVATVSNWLIATLLVQPFVARIAWHITDDELVPQIFMRVCVCACTERVYSFCCMPLSSAKRTSIISHTRLTNSVNLIAPSFSSFPSFLSLSLTLSNVPLTVVLAIYALMLCLPRRMARLQLSVNRQRLSSVFSPLIWQQNCCYIHRSSITFTID